MKAKVKVEMRNKREVLIAKFAIHLVGQFPLITLQNGVAAMEARHSTINKTSIIPY